MTDSEIKKAFECCADINDKCPECPLKDKNRESCVGIFMSNALALINRLQAEVERLNAENKLLIDNDVSNKYPNCVLVEKGRIYTKTLEDYDELIGNISAEGIKEFAEKLKEHCFEALDSNEDLLTADLVCAVKEVTIDNLLKEMVGEDNAE